MDSKTFINKIALKLNRTPEDVASDVKSLANLIAESVKDGDSIAVPGFGSFEPKMKKERVASHPSSGKKLLVPPKLTMVFKPSAILKQKVK